MGKGVFHRETNTLDNHKYLRTKKSQAIFSIYLWSQGLDCLTPTETNQWKSEFCIDIAVACIWKGSYICAKISLLVGLSFFGSFLLYDLVPEVFRAHSNYDFFWFSADSYCVIILVINLSLRFISRFGILHEDFTLKEGTVPLPFGRNRPENHSHSLGKALGDGLGLLKTGSLLISLSLSTLCPFHLSLSLFLSISLLSPSLSIFLLLPFFLSLSFSLSSLYYSLWRI